MVSKKHKDIQQSTTRLADYYSPSNHQSKRYRLPFKLPAKSRLHPNLIIYNTYVRWKDNNSSEFGWIFSTKSGRRVTRDPHRLQLSAFLSWQRPQRSSSPSNMPTIWASPIFTSLRIHHNLSRSSIQRFNKKKFMRFSMLSSLYLLILL
ncbi:unnamed protein product [Arabidopsis halleri]